MMSGRVGQKEIVALFTTSIASAYGFGIFLFPAIVESIRYEIDFSYGAMGLVSGSVQAGFFVSSAMAGFLTLRFGTVNLILFPIIVCGLSLGGLPAANSVYVLAALLLIPGGGASLIRVPMVEVSREIVPPRNRGKAVGLISSGTSYSVFINPALLAAVLPVYGWRALWAVTGAIVSLLAICSVVRLKHLRNGHRQDAALQTAAPGAWARVVALP